MNQAASWVQSIVNIFTKRDQLNKQAVSRVDQSLGKLEELAQKGYDTVLWDAGLATCFRCRELNGQEWPMDEFVLLTHHEAPVFSKSHPNCTCTLVVRGFNLPEIAVDTY